MELKAWVSLPSSAVLIALLTGCGSIVAPGADPGSVPQQPSGIGRIKARSGIADCPRVRPQPAAPNGLPAKTLACLGGGPGVNLAGLRGRPTIISVWAQWCGPCRAEAPILRAAVPQLEGLGIRFLGADFYDPMPTSALEFAHQAGWHFPQLFAPNRGTFWSVHVTAPPQTIFIDRNGKVVDVHAGAFQTSAELINAAHDAFGTK